MHLDQTPAEDLHLELKERSQRNRRRLKGRLPGVGYLPARGDLKPLESTPKEEPDP